MKSQRQVSRKTAKAKARRKDYVKRKNINKNVPSVVSQERVELYRNKRIAIPERYERPKNARPKIITSKQVFDGEGRPEIEYVGSKLRTVKTKKYHRVSEFDPTKPARDLNNRVVGMIQYPKPRKYAQCKKMRVLPGSKK